MRLPCVAFADLALVRLTFYDPPGTGGGVSAKAFDYGAPWLVVTLRHIVNDCLYLVSDLLHEAFEVVESCRCKDGCVRCEHCDRMGISVLMPRTRYSKFYMQGEQPSML